MPMLELLNACCQVAVSVLVIVYKHDLKARVLGICLEPPWRAGDDVWTTADGDCRLDYLLDKAT